MTRSTHLAVIGIFGVCHVAYSGLHFNLFVISTNLCAYFCILLYKFSILVHNFYKLFTSIRDDFVFQKFQFALN